jgi:hypothetical protein
VVEVEGGIGVDVGKGRERRERGTFIILREKVCENRVV